jgi:hypothetical protein
MFLDDNSFWMPMPSMSIPETKFRGTNTFVRHRHASGLA